MAGSGSSIVVLRALEGTPLTDQRIRAIVVSTAWAIGERAGIRVRSVEAEDDRVRVELECDRLPSIAFAAELRRLTERWYATKFPEARSPLWGLGPDRKESEQDIGSEPETDSPDGWKSPFEEDDDWWRGGESDLGPPG